MYGNECVTRIVGYLSNDNLFVFLDIQIEIYGNVSVINLNSFTGKNYPFSDGKKGCEPLLAIQDVRYGITVRRLWERNIA